MKTEIYAKSPLELIDEARAFVAQGGVADLERLVAEALRRYLHSSSAQVTEEFLREDMKWGLHGRE